MANIKVQDLTSIAGADLFNDSESFMRDLSDREISLQGGAIGPHPFPTGVKQWEKEILPTPLMVGLE
jgi:tryptophan synthase beta subunit